MKGREAALRALLACRKNGAWSDGALKECLKDMDRREAALASCLCYGVMQNRLCLEHWLAPFVRGKLQPAVREILQLALFQITMMDKIPSSAAVNEAVNLAKIYANPQAARLVNGVLRSVLRAMPLPMPEELSVRYSHPQELVELLGENVGHRLEALLQSHNTTPPTVLQVNPLRITAEELQSILVQGGAKVESHPWLNNCLTVTGSGSIDRLDAFKNGLFYVQDAAARLAVMAAGVEPGMRVLDCCAAPGGKSFAAALAMEDRGELISCDIHAHKLKLIEKGAQRLGISILRTQLQDASKWVPEWESAMDVVIADVPCSGLGTIRKKPDIRYKDLKQTEKLPELQLRILKNQASYVKPGGVLLFSTCTILRRENQAVARAFLEENPDYVLEDVEFPEGSGIPTGAMTTLLPCDYDTDGFFICKFRRKS
ncbi:MAG: 16S rRNA (cytosine(967)-C(5))-methyltransferase RsmB [Oscillospiraceae bacterium]|nr:16S rRNA (cytosine(967)-C(5))-methyltransferase RsmB [Oscillospiraceae bacterium]